MTDTRTSPETAAEAAYGLVRAAGSEYACSFPLDRLTRSLLAVERDGEPIPIDRGGPIRLLPAGDDVDCWEQIKQVTEIDVRVGDPTAEDTAREMALGRFDE